jgi:Ser/Thr protein kinase RdoA (MazF antagonist)
MQLLPEIAEAFTCPGKLTGVVPWGSGHINETYLATYSHDGKPSRYIHQKVNHHVFKDVSVLMRNIGWVTRHQRAKFVAAGVPDVDRRVLTLVPTQDGNDYFRDGEGNFWRTYVFIEGSRGIDIVESTSQAYEAAKAFGEFQCQLADLPVRLNETIPDFHHARYRFDAWARVVEADPFNRAAMVKDEIAFILKRESLVDSVLDLLAAGELPERVTHNDTKLNNVLLDAETEKALCVIDLDTVMPGSVLYDFGDMVRTTTSKVAEDDCDPLKVGMDIDYFEALVRGYLETASGFLTAREVGMLPRSGQLITLELGIRFLTDYLEGDHYFKTSRPNQNLDRCRKQFLMVRSMEEQVEDMCKVVSKYT